MLCAKEGKKRVPSTRAEKTGLHPNFTCVRGDKGCRNPIPAGMLRKLPQVRPRPKKFKRLTTRGTLHGSRPNLQQREPDGRIVPTPPDVWDKGANTKRCARRKKKITIIHIHMPVWVSPPDNWRCFISGDRWYITTITTTKGLTGPRAPMAAGPDEHDEVYSSLIDNVHIW